MTESTIAPKQVAVEPNGDKVDVILTENVTQIDRDGIEIYQYDTYRLTVCNRPNLQHDIESNFASWLAFAKGEISRRELVVANKSDIVAKLKDAIQDNKTYLDRVSPTVAQNTNEIQKLARQNNRIIRYLLSMFEDDT